MGIVTNLLDDTASTGLTDWTVSGGGSLSGIRITTAAGQTRTYTRTDHDVNGIAFMLEAVLSAQSLGSDTERGARMWVKFNSSALPPMLVHHAEVRLYRETGTYKLGLFSTDGVGAALATLDLDWTNAADRLRVRLKRQQIAGTDYVFLQAESSSGWDDPAQPNNLSSANSQGVQLTAANFPGVSASYEIGFGNAVAGAYYSDWESLHLSVCDDQTTVLPYWPPAPPDPTVVHDDKGVGNPQGIDLAADCSASGYLANDSVRAELDADATTYSGAASSPPGNESWDFDGLGDDQGVTGRVIAADVSGRETAGNDVAGSVPDRTAPVVTINGVSDGAYYDAAVTPTFSASDAHLDTVSATLDGAPFTSGSSVGSEGSHTLQVTGTDLEGNSATETVTFTIDLTDPVISVTGVSHGGVYGGTVNPTFSASDTNLDTVSATLDGAPFTSGDPVAAEGPHSLIVTAVDLSGRSVQQTVDFTIDLTDPDGDILVFETGGADFVAPIGLYGIANEPTAICVDVDASEANLDTDQSTLTINGVTKKFDDLDHTPGTRRWTWDSASVTLGLVVKPALNTVSVHLQDLAGRTDSGLINTDFELDLTPPTAAIMISEDNGGSWVAPVNGATYDKPLRVALEIPDAHFQDLHFDDGLQSGPFPSYIEVDSVRHDLDYTKFIYTHVMPGNLHRLELGDAFHDLDVDGPHTVEAYVQDTAGNGSTPLYQVNFTVAVPPTGLIKLFTINPPGWIDPPAPPNDYFTHRPVRVAVETSNTDLNLAACRIIIPGVGTTTLDTVTPTTGPGGGDLYEASAPIDAEGNFTVTVELEDSGGLTNVNPITAAFLVDTLAPAGFFEASLDDGASWDPIAATYASGTVDLCFAILDTVLDLDPGNSTFELEKAGSPVDHRLFSALVLQSGGGYNRYRFPVDVDQPGTYTLRVQTHDQTGSASVVYTHTFVYGAPDFFIAGSAGNNASAIWVDHDGPDGNNIDASGQIYSGPGEDNFIGVRISNEVGAATGDCLYRVFTIPACLFVGTTFWELISDNLANDNATVIGTPVVPGIAGGTEVKATGVRNFNNDHPNFPDDAAFWAAHAQGDTLHTCTCVVIHATHDPLMLPDASGTLQPISDSDFTDVNNFINVVMAKIDAYNGGTGDYWQAVYNNKKIANRNINIKNVGTP